MRIPTKISACALIAPSLSLALVAAASNAPAAQPEVVTGTFAELIIDRSDETSETAHAVRIPGDGLVPVSFVRGEPTARSGDIVRLVGRHRDDAIVVADASRDMRVVDEADDPPNGEQRRVAFLLLNFKAGEEPTRHERLSDMFHRGVNTREDIPDFSVQAYFDEVSYGQEHFVSTIRDRADLEDDVYGWYTIERDPQAGCDLYEWGRRAEKLAKADGFQIGDYEHVAVVWPRNSACGLSGMGEFDGTYSWYNGLGRPSVLLHEFGHNLGASHASTLRCHEDGLPVSMSDDPNGCLRREYGDLFDVMGFSPSYRHMSTFAKARAGWLDDSTGVIDASAGGTFQITAVEEPASGVTGPRGIKVAWPDPELNWHYYVEFRTPRGYDRNPPGGAGTCSLFPRPPAEEDWMACSFAPVNGTGVQIRLARGVDDKDGSRTYLVDTTPETDGHGANQVNNEVRADPDQELTAGRTFRDRHRGISITLDSVEQGPSDPGGPPMFANVTVSRDGE